MGEEHHMSSAFLRTPGMSRRQLLGSLGQGFASLALTGLLAEEAAKAAAETPLADRPAYLLPAARAKRVIFLFMPGGPSQVDTFDPKPRLAVDSGKPLPLDTSKLATHMNRGKLLPSPFKFQPYGESATEVSELFPHVASHIDDICVVRSMMHEDPNHTGGCFLMNAGDRVFSRPSVGAWVTYGLGSENQNLPGFVAIGPGQPLEGARQYGNAFLPAVHQATFVSDMKDPIRNLRDRPVALDRQRLELDALKQLNEFHRQDRSEDSRLSARIESFELAYRMQAEAPDAFDLGKETAETLRLYGIGSEPTDAFGRQCLLARRLSERGVRFVQLFDTQGGFQPWDQHDKLKASLTANAARTDLPVAGLLADLKKRGLLDDTLVIWGGEFGRTPTAQGNDGRDHHPYGFSMWLAGGGIRGGTVYGATDEFGFHAIENKVHVHDLHATILHLLGIDHTKLTYRYAGRDYRLTDVFGNVVDGILS
jgi:hypothetical protein